MVEMLKSSNLPLLCQRRTNMVEKMRCATFMAAILAATLSVGPVSAASGLFSDQPTST
jgi:hypothetical protein